MYHKVNLKGMYTISNVGKTASMSMLILYIKQLTCGSLRSLQSISHDKSVEKHFYRQHFEQTIAVRHTQISG